MHHRKPPLADCVSRGKKQKSPLALRLSLALLCAAWCGAGGAAAAESSAPVATPAQPQAVEHIYYCFIYGPEQQARFLMPEVLRRLGFRGAKDLWTYTNAARNKVYYFHFVENAEGMLAALSTEDAHIIINGHSNYGMGCVFATYAEQMRQSIATIRHPDDDRMLNFSSPWVAINIPKLLTRQAYPNWWPVFKDGANAIAPYDFDDPRGNPAYNYYVTYQVPGDPTRYKIEPVPHSGVERFPDSGVPAWYSPDGRAPDPRNPAERASFLVNTNTSFVPVGRWTVGYAPEGFWGSNYLFTAAGSGTNEVKWQFAVEAPGDRVLSTRWPALPRNVTNAQFVVVDAKGRTVVPLNQQTNGGEWVALGTFSFARGTYSVSLNNAAASGPGNVVADALRIASPAGGSGSNGGFELIVDNTTAPKPHFGKKTLVMRGKNRVDPAAFRYRRLFYEGCLSGTCYLDTFQRGVTFYTMADSYLSVFETYLRGYLRGDTDEQMWRAMQRLEPVFDYYDFSLPPARQQPGRAQPVAAASDPEPEGDAGLQRTARGSATAVWEALRRAAYVHDESRSKALIRAAFDQRRDEALALALWQMSTPLIEKNDEGRQSRIRALVAARRIIETFPDTGVPRMLELYARSNALVRGNVIRCLGGLGARPEIRDLLVQALDDQTVCEEPGWNSGGDLMRLCDHAYNQLVLCDQVPGVLHTVSPVLTLDQRQYHIGELKKKLPGSARGAAK
jgi:hypothetical protein